MVKRLLLAAGALIALSTAPVGARLTLPESDDSAVDGGGGVDLPPYLQCVPYARQVSGIQIRGDAWTWWNQAEGHYARGYAPKVGAVMALRPHGNSHLGHVAAVSKIIDARTILIRHANWSPINGRRGQIEDNVRVVDVSLDNDWSEVRVWYAPIQALGGSHWPVQGFIYNKKPKKSEHLIERQTPEPVAKAEAAPAPAPEAQQAPAPTPPPARRAVPRPRKGTFVSNDPIADIIRMKMGW